MNGTSGMHAHEMEKSSPHVVEQLWNPSRQMLPICFEYHIMHTYQKKKNVYIFPELTTINLPIPGNRSPFSKPRPHGRQLSIHQEAQPADQVRRPEHGHAVQLLPSPAARPPAHPRDEAPRRHEPPLERRPVQEAGIGQLLGARRR